MGVARGTYGEGDEYLQCFDILCTVHFDSM
jgi:hypothetical protein